MTLPNKPASLRCPPLPEHLRSQPYRPTGKEPGYDDEPPEFRIRKDHIYAGGKRESVESLENSNHSRALWLYTHGKIEQRQFLASVKLAKDWELSQISGTASTILVGAGGKSGDVHPNDAKRDAMKRHGAAVKALGRCWAIVELVVQNNLSVEKASAQLRVHHRFGSGALNVALHFLADHYKLD